MIYLSGDTHGTTDAYKITDWYSKLPKPLTSEDYLIVLGDFGLLWTSSKGEHEENVLRFWKQFPFQVLWIDGNHENFERINTLPVMDKCCGKVGKINDQIYHLRRGEVFFLDDRCIWVMGGAFSIDVDTRIPSVSWWQEEIPSNKEFCYGLDMLDKYNNKVDIILSHTGPQSICKEYMAETRLGEFDQTRFPNLRTVETYLDVVKSKVQYKHWYFGHWHDDWKSQDKKHTMLYDKVKKI